MAKIFSLSSQVSHGFVGNSAIEFALQRLGHEVWTIPTVLLSNHPAYEHYGGIRLKSSMLRPILEGLDMNEALDRVDAVITGYLPTEDLVNFAIETVALVKTANPDAIYLCDPVYGDRKTGLYIEEMAAKTHKYELLPLADILTPNSFELSWLTDMPVNTLDQALEAIEMLSPEQILSTSIPGDTHTLLNVLDDSEDTLITSHKMLQNTAHGTGDLLSAFYLAEYHHSRNKKQALGKATGYLEKLIGLSENQTELALVSTQDIWTKAEESKVEIIKEKTKS